MKTELTLCNRSLTLFRYPKRENETLQAWDAGDEYLINHIEEMALQPNQQILVLNDQFGALSCWFSKNHNVTSITDSFIAQQGAKFNLETNQCNDVRALTSVDSIPNNIDIVILQIPRNNRYLKWQLSQLRQALNANVPVIAVNKAKEIHTSTLNLFERYLGTTTTSLAKKKHRLVFSSANSAAQLPPEPLVEWDVDEEDIHLKNLPNVYSGESLDLGARFMLKHIPQNNNLKHVIDLGCGNGVLSVKVGQLNPEIKITCIDESYMATASAKQNLLDNLGDQRQVNCITNNCLDGINIDDCDLILCNPPFHQQQAITDHIAWQMFCDAKHVLRNGGQLIVIGNRHLGYDVKLSKLFGKSQVKTLATNNKFVIFIATK